MDASLPVAPRIEIADIEPTLQPMLDSSHSSRDLAGDEGLATHRSFVIEQDPIRSVDTVGFAIIDGDPIGIEFGRSIRRAGIERGRLSLRFFLCASVKLRGRGLVESYPLLHAEDSNRLKQS